jgi:hypothetical protein
MTSSDQLLRRTQWERQLSGLRLLAADADGLPSARTLAAEVRDGTNAVIAEVEASSRAVLASVPREPGKETFLWVRVARLAHAADQAVDAARDGDLSGLRAHMQHFDSLTLAAWTVQNAIGRPDPVAGLIFSELPARSARGWPA